MKYGRDFLGPWSTSSQILRAKTELEVLLFEFCGAVLISRWWRGEESLTVGVQR